MEKNRTVAETIKYYTAQHLSHGNLLYGQCVSAVGWVGGTVPDVDGIVELPTSDSSNSGIVCGAALAGKKPIYVIRYQGFINYNVASLFNYAAKSLEMWNEPCPIFIRAIAMEGNIGPVASNMHHSMAMRMPGIKVVSPMTPREWQDTFVDFVIGHKPVYCSEHRKSFPVDYEIPNVFEYDEPEVTLFVIGPTRIEINKNLNLLKNSGYRINIVNLVSLKPLITYISEQQKTSIEKSRFGIVIDDDFETCGASQSIAYKLMHMYKIPVHTMCLKDRTAGFASQRDNIAPTVKEILEYIERNTRD